VASAFKLPVTTFVIFPFNKGVHGNVTAAINNYVVYVPKITIKATLKAQIHFGIKEE
jgi:hypothetical protein